jgi:pilus assembly protein CpaB
LKMSKRRVMLLLSTGASALFAGLLYGYLRSVELTARPPVEQTTLVVAAKTDIPPRMRLTGDMLYMKEVPRGFAFADEFDSISDVEGRVTRSEILTEEPIRESRLVGRNELSSLSLELPPDKRAVTVKVNEVVGVAGFVKPGDRVDVMSTFAVGDKGEHLTTTVVEDVYVIGVSQELTADEDKAAKLASSVTLAVSPEAAARVVLAEETGTIRLVLRPLEGWTTARAKASTVDLVGAQYAHHFRDPVDRGVGASSAAATEREKQAPGTAAPMTDGPSLAGSPRSADPLSGRYTVVQVIRGTHVTDVVVAKEEER